MKIIVIFPKPNTMGYLHLLMNADKIPNNVYVPLKNGKLVSQKRYFAGDQLSNDLVLMPASRYFSGDPFSDGT